MVPLDDARSFVLGGCAPLPPATVPLADALGLVLAGRLGEGAHPTIALLGKLAMAEVFLVALYIVVVKGVGLGHVTPAWGLWLFTACVLVQIAIAELASRASDCPAGR